MFGIKTFVKKKADQALIKLYITNKFPQKGRNKFLLNIYLNRIFNHLRQGRVTNSLGWLYAKPDKDIAQIYSKFVCENPNNLGNWSIDKPKNFTTQQLERNVITQLIDLLEANNEKIHGYITSGGSEGNIFSMWMGRKFLESKSIKKIALLRTSLTHYSVIKAADLCNIQKEFLIPLNSNLSIDVEGFISTVRRAIKQGYYNFLLPITLGYTQSGTSDPYEIISEKIDYLKKNKKVNIYCWIDASTSGLIYPFIQKDFTPFRYKNIQTFVVDFHKMGGTPYSTGVVLYRANLSQYISRDVNYLPETDATLLGSRPGAAAVSIWYAIQLLGKEGYKKNIEKKLKLKNDFIKRLRINNRNIEIVSEETSLQCCILLNEPINLPKNIQEKYGLYSKKVNLLYYKNSMKNKYIYKFYFMPHVSEKTLQNIETDIFKKNIN